MTLRPSDIPADIVEQLNRGKRETANLAEGLAMDSLELVRHAVPEAHAAALEAVQPEDKVTKRMVKLGRVMYDTLGPDGFERLAAHTSDTVRSWAAYLLAETPGLTLAQRLDRVRPLADDHHFGVREWAWMGLRSFIKEEIEHALELFEPWVHEDSANIRRYAIEATRPRGVWCAHIGVLKDDPAPALPLLEPLRADTEKYVQDSVANWLNDAAKSRPEWVIELTDRWLSKSSEASTARIVKRARRSIA